MILDVIRGMLIPKASTNLQPDELPKQDQSSHAESVFVSFSCDCGLSIDIMSRIFPGQAVVTNCPNCELSWTVYNPQLAIRRTKEIPRELQDIVWGKLSQ